jgi:MFS family permease
MSIGTFILFIAANVSNNLISTVLYSIDFGMLGYYNLGIYYFSFGVFSFLAVPVVMRLGDKWSLIVGCLTYTFMVGSQIPPCWRYDHKNALQSDGWYNFMYGFMLLSCAVNGWGASILYVAQGKYVAEIANSKNVGFFNSIIWLSSMVTIVVGNLIAAPLILYFSYSVLWIFLTLLCLVAAVFFAFLKPPRPQPVKESKSKAS